MVNLLYAELLSVDSEKTFKQNKFFDSFSFLFIMIKIWKWELRCFLRVIQCYWSYFSLRSLVINTPFIWRPSNSSKEIYGAVDDEETSFK